MCSGDVHLNDTMADGTTEREDMVESSSSQMGYNTTNKIAGGGLRLERNSEMMIGLLIFALVMRNNFS